MRHDTGLRRLASARLHAAAGLRVLALLLALLAASTVLGGCGSSSAGPDPASAAVTGTDPDERGACGAAEVGVRAAAKTQDVRKVAFSGACSLGTIETSLAMTASGMNRAMQICTAAVRRLPLDAVTVVYVTAKSGEELAAGAAETPCMSGVAPSASP